MANIRVFLPSEVFRVISSKCSVPRLVESAVRNARNGTINPLSFVIYCSLRRGNSRKFDVEFDRKIIGSTWFWVQRCGSVNPMIPMINYRPSSMAEMCNVCLVNGFNVVCRDGEFNKLSDRDIDTIGFLISSRLNSL